VKAGINLYWRAFPALAGFAGNAAEAAYTFWKTT